MNFQDYKQMLERLMEVVNEKIQQARPGIDPAATIPPKEMAVYCLRIWVTPYITDFLLLHLNVKLDPALQKKNKSLTTLL
ncbi:unnamed protein product [Heterosigma akashiwo]|mmetsp:Transcript_25395/g.35116  ORF Transcript_25395/g.35116 Transcript_25395/m.35116 type:complete len:80 (-) Transcript_25395:90-329(-)